MCCLSSRKTGNDLLFQSNIIGFEAEYLLQKFHRKIEDVRDDRGTNQSEFIYTPKQLRSDIPLKKNLDLTAKDKAIYKKKPRKIDHAHKVDKI